MAIIKIEPGVFLLFNLWFEFILLLLPQSASPEKLGNEELGLKKLGERVSKLEKSSKCKSKKIFNECKVSLKSFTSCKENITSKYIFLEV